MICISNKYLVFSLYRYRTPHATHKNSAPRGVFEKPGSEKGNTLQGSNPCPGSKKINMDWTTKDITWGENKSSKIVEQKAKKRIIKNDKIHRLKAKALSDLCIKPELDEQWRIITEKQFNAYALILYLIESEIIEEMHLAIYRINEPTVRSIIDLIDSGRIKKATFVISNFFNQTKKPERWALMLRAYAERKQNVNHKYTHNHAKVLCVKTKTGYYVFEGSGNMSDNARIEQYLFENNKEIYEFHKEWMENITENG